MEANTVDTLKVASSERSHHKYGMSKLNYLKKCPLHEGLGGTNEAAEDGQTLHDIMDDVAEAVKKSGNTFYGALVEDVLEHRVVDDPDRELLTYCCRQVDGYIGALRGKVEIHNEIKVSITKVTGEEINHGYLDLLLVAGPVGVLIDYKFGYLPVPPAGSNYQGKGYGIGCFEKFPGLKRILVVFIQPKLNLVTTAILTRDETVKYYTQVEHIINTAKWAQNAPNDPAVVAAMEVGDHCKYCARAGRCAKLLNYAGIAANEVAKSPEELLPITPLFRGDLAALSRPEQYALARHWADLLEPAFEKLKSRSLEVAAENGGVLECQLPDGTVVTYTDAEKRVDRVLGSAPLVADALKDILEPQQLLAAAKLSIGELERMAGAEMQKSVNTVLDDELQEFISAVQLKVEAGAISQKEAKALVKEKSRDLRDQKISKKEAASRVCSLLESEGLLSRPDTTIHYLKKTVTKPVTSVITNSQQKQITQ
jgi:hypothetical protein